jgi:hypothetical protein
MRHARKRLVQAAALAASFGFAWSVSAKSKDAGEAMPARPPLPEIKSIATEPAALTLQTGRDDQQVLVWGAAADGRKFDLTDDATFKPDSASLEVGPDHYIHGKAPGQSHVTITAAGKSLKLAVNVVNADLPPVRFGRDVMPVLAKSGCNAGTCHGGQKGKNGFKLSLRGYDTAWDYHALVEELQGRRVNRVQPDQSLMLLKATSTVPHEGSQAIADGSAYYKLLYQWIKEGVKNEPDPANARPTSIEVLPAVVDLDLPGRSQRVIVLAHFKDGTARDVTRESILTSSNTDAAKIKENRLTAIRRGEGAVLVRYEGNYAAAPFGIMGDRNGYAFKPMAESNFIDAHVNAKLQKVKSLPSELCTDSDFVRRIYIDLIGVPPTGEQARAFVEDTAPSKEKRAKLIVALMSGGDYVAYWSNRWADLLQCNSKMLGKEGVWIFREWIRESIAQNKPYNQFAYELITAQGSNYTNPAASYLLTLGRDKTTIDNGVQDNLAHVDTGKITEDVSQTFLGVRFNCNKCHDHPFERWTQSQYYQFGAYFAQVKFKKGERGDEVVVYASHDGGEVTHPRTNLVVPPVVPYGASPSLAGEPIRNRAFADWMTSPQNPLFAKSYVNRMWSYFFGLGIIDPVDDIRAGNPPTNAALLDALTEDFVKHNFDTRHLIQTIVSSTTYQLSLVPNKWNEDDKINFSHNHPRRLGAEQMMDAVAIATGTRDRVPGLPDGMRSVYAPDGVVEGSDFLRLFGRPKRESACECERTNNVSLAHALNLINGPTISDAVANPGSKLVQLVQADPDNPKAVTQIYYMILGRPATAAEIKDANLGEGPARVEAAQDLAWALLNSPAFLFNR